MYMINLLFILGCALLFTIAVLLLLGKMDFLIGKSLKMEMYGSLRRKRILTAVSLVLSTIPYYFFVDCRDNQSLIFSVSGWCAFATVFLGVLDWILSKKDRQALDMNPAFVSRMIQNEKYNLSRMNKLSLLTAMALGAGLVVIHFFAWNALYMKIFFALYVMFVIAIGILTLTWAKKK